MSAISLLKGYFILTIKAFIAAFFNFIIGLPVINQFIWLGKFIWKKISNLSFVKNVQATIKEKGLIWALIYWQTGRLQQILAFAGFLILFSLVFGSRIDAFAFIVSMYLHEAGHAMVFKWTKIDHRVLLLFPLGAVAAPINKEEDAKSDLLHWNAISWLLHMGPMVNVILMVASPFIAAGLQNMHVDWTLHGYNHWNDLVIFFQKMGPINALLAVFNLIPFWNMDAGQLFKVIFSSLDEKEDQILLWSIFAIVGAGFTMILVPAFVNLSLNLAIYGILVNWGWVIFVLFMLVGLNKKSKLDKPEHAESPQAMSNLQVYMHLAIFAAMAIITLVNYAGPLQISL